MKYLFLLSVSLLCALSSSSLSGSSESFRYTCGILLDVYESQYFDTEAKAKSMCSTFHTIYGVESGCVTRGLADSTWEANFRFRKYFVGNNSIKEYQDWSKDSVHKGYMIRHQIYYSGKCQTEYDY